MKTYVLIATIALGAASLQAQPSLSGGLDQLSAPTLETTIKVYPSPPLSPDPAPVAPAVVIDNKGCMCTQDYAPVTCFGGATFPNSCHAQCAGAKNCMRRDGH